MAHHRGRRSRERHKGYLTQGAQSGGRRLGPRPGRAAVNEQPLDLGRVLRTLRRRWRWLGGLIAVGVAYGTLLTLIQSPVYKARSLVLLPPSATDPQGRPLRSMETEAAIAKSAEILQAAGATFDPPLSARTLRDKVETQVLSADILRVDVEAGRARAAKELADAVANAYVSYSNGAAAVQADSRVAVLQAQGVDLDRRIRELETEINAGIVKLSGLDQRSAEAARQVALLDAMRTEQVEASRQLSTVNGRIADVKLSAQLSSRGTRVLQTADMPSRAAQPRPLFNIGGAGVVGMLAGVVIALAFDRNDGRLRRRGDIARAVGAPVVASLSVPRRKREARCRALLDLWQPNVVEALALRQAFTRLGVADEQPPANVLVVTLPGDPAGPLLALEMGAFAASMATSTAVVIASDDRSTAEVRTACAAARNSPVRPRLWVHDLTSATDSVDLRHADLSLAVVVSDGKALTAPTWGRRTLAALVVTAGHATPEELAAAALACADSGHPVRGVVVANPDANDRTSGLLRPAMAARDQNGNGHRSAPQQRRAGSVGGGPNGVAGRQVAP